MRRLVIAALTLVAVPTLAQPPADTAKIGPNNDPNQIVCVRESQVGSRLASQRVCRTRAEWAEHRRMYRNSVDRAQQQMQTSCRPTPSMEC
jgi:hypothetical protein